MDGELLPPPLLSVFFLRLTPHDARPAFFDSIPGAITRKEDRSLFSVRTEINCAACGGVSGRLAACSLPCSLYCLWPLHSAHQGHVFKGEGFSTPTDEHHCGEWERDPPVSLDGEHAR